MYTSKRQTCNTPQYISQILRSPNSFKMIRPCLIFFLVYIEKP